MLLARRVELLNEIPHHLADLVRQKAPASAMLTRQMADVFRF